MNRDMKSWIAVSMLDTSLSLVNAFARRRNVLQHRAGLAMDEKDLLHLVAQAAQQRDLAERLAGAQRLQAPLHALQREAALHHEVDGLGHAAEGVGDGLAHGVANDGRKRGGEDAGILVDGDLAAPARRWDRTSVAVRRRA